MTRPTRIVRLSRHAIPLDDPDAGNWNPHSEYAEETAPSMNNLEPEPLPLLHRAASWPPDTKTAQLHHRRGKPTWRFLLEIWILHINSRLKVFRDRIWHPLKYIYYPFSLMVSLLLSIMATFRARPMFSTTWLMVLLSMLYFALNLSSYIYHSHQISPFLETLLSEHSQINTNSSHTTVCRPDWLYTTPFDILHIPTPPYIELFPPRSALAIMKQQRICWHPDKVRSRLKENPLLFSRILRLNSTWTADDWTASSNIGAKIWKRITEAEVKITQALNKGKGLPKRMRNAAKHIPCAPPGPRFSDRFTQPVELSPSWLIGLWESDGLPHLQPSCLCTPSRAYQDFKMALWTPWFRHSSLPWYPPTSTDGVGTLATHCPCSIRHAWNRWSQSVEMMPPSWHPFYNKERLWAECEIESSPLYQSCNLTRSSYRCSNGVLDIFLWLFSGQRHHASSFFDISDHEKEYYWREGLVEESMVTLWDLHGDEWYIGFKNDERKKEDKRHYEESMEWIAEMWEEDRLEKEEKEEKEEEEIKLSWWGMLDVGRLQALLMNHSPQNTVTPETTAATT